MTLRAGPIATVVREFYMPYPREGLSFVINNQHVGWQGLDRYQLRTRQVHDDVCQANVFRYLITPRDST